MILKAWNGAIPGVRVDHNGSIPVGRRSVPVGAPERTVFGSRTLGKLADLWELRRFTYFWYEEATEDGDGSPYRLKLLPDQEVPPEGIAGVLMLGSPYPSEINFRLHCTTTGAVIELVRDIHPVEPRVECTLLVARAGATIVVARDSSVVAAGDPASGSASTAPTSSSTTTLWVGDGGDIRSQESRAEVSW